jgi:transmembrane sensor
MTEPNNQQILEEAGTWFIEFRTGNPTPRAREEFMRWLRRSPDHIRAYLDVSRHYVQMPGSGNVSLAEADRLLEKARVRLTEGVVPIEEGRASPSSVPVRAARTIRRPVTVGVAATILILTAAATLYMFSQRGLYSTGLGEERTVTLEDASRIELNARTKLRVRYSKGAREIELIEGQALFQVAKDKGRPFLVHAGGTLVRAVGTEFDVYRKTSGTTVTVLEGRVAVFSDAPGDPSASASPDAASQRILPRPLPRDSSPSDSSYAASPTQDSSSAAIFLLAGEQVTVTSTGVPALKTANISAATAWTRGEFEFIETPLTEVAEEFNRSSPRRFVLSSPSLVSVRISGVYSSADPASLILFLKNQPDLIVSERGNEIRIDRR